MNLFIYSNGKRRLYQLRRIVAVLLLLQLVMLAIFHCLVLLRIIPFDFIWGGKLQDTSQMVLFEVVSLIINLVMIGIVAISAGVIKSKIHPIVIKVVLWTMFLLFILSTIGNFNSENKFEKNVFTPLTLLLSILCLIFILCAPRQVQSLQKNKEK